MKMKSDYNLPFTNKNEDQVVFQNPWHSQLFAITVQLSEKGNFSWKEFVKVFGEALKKERLHTKNLDAVRNQNILDYIPEFTEYWHD